MTPPVPVPSKAAIRALRGLALGTSCAIGAIVEDRRRRITTLQTAVSNKEKLQSARRYKSSPDEASTWLPYDEGSVAIRSEPIPRDRSATLGSSELPTQKRDNHDKPRSERPLPAQDESKQRKHEFGHERQDGAVAYAQRSFIGRRRHAKVPSPPNQQARGNVPAQPWGLSTKSTTLQPEEIAAIIGNIKNELANKSDETSIDRAVAEYLRGCELTNAYETHGDEWKTVSAQLAQECQQRGRWKHALAIIRIAIRPGTINEAEFYAHAPIVVIRKLISPDDSGTISRDNFNTAVSLFNTMFPEKPQMHGKEIEELGKELITVARRLHHVRSMESIYWRVLPQSNDCDFIGWFIQSLYDTGEHNRAVKHFLLGYAKGDPSHQNFQATIECVVRAVEQTTTAKASQVLHAFSRMRNAADGTLRSRWVARLLDAHWVCHENYESFRALFEDIRTQGLLERTSHPQGAFRMVIEHALDTGQDEEAERYYNEATQLFPKMREDIAIKGYFALRQIQKGNWTAAEHIFEEMKQLVTSGERQAEYIASFHQFLKAFAKRNTVEDVRAFMDKYVSNHGIKLDTWMMTIVANKYGAAGDMHGFFSWLEYCFASGVPLDAVFCNVILDACRMRWSMPYKQLRQLSKKMGALDPAYVDDVTRHILRMSASATARSEAYLKDQLDELPIDKRTLAGQTLDPHFLADAMYYHMKKGKPALAAQAYERATTLGMPHSDQCLRLAVIASFRMQGRGHEAALNLIRKSLEKGHSVSRAATEYLKLEMDRVRGLPELVLDHMQKTVAQLEALQIELPPAAYADTALTCVRIGQHERARLLCKLAMDKAGATNPCFTRQTFRALLMSYSQTLDVARLKDLVTALLDSPLAVEGMTKDMLKSVRRTVQKMNGNAERIKEVLGVLQVALEDTKARRLKAAGQNEVISSEAMRIMNDAVTQFEAIKQVEEEFRKLEEEAHDTMVADEREEDERSDGPFYMAQFRLKGDVEKLGYRITTRRFRNQAPRNDPPPRRPSRSRSRPSYISLLGEDDDSSSSDVSAASHAAS